MRPRLITFDWRSIKKWCLLVTIVMLGWLVFPVARCTLAAFRDTPLSETAPHDPSGGYAPQPDDEAAEDEPGFFGKLATAGRACYAQHPLFAQGWKSHLLVVFAALAVLAYGMAYLQAGKAKME